MVSIAVTSQPETVSTQSSSVYSAPFSVGQESGYGLAGSSALGLTAAVRVLTSLHSHLGFYWCPCWQNSVCGTVGLSCGLLEDTPVRGLLMAMVVEVSLLDGPILLRAFTSHDPRIIFLLID